jgi:glutamate racemase
MRLRSPILVLDSGLGGLTVARALRSRLPSEDLVYFGDTARLPYGNKSPETITSFVRGIISYLLPMDPKHIVIACNTATAVALPSLRQAFPNVPITGVIEPGARAASDAAGPKDRPTIGVIATEATVRSKAYEKAIQKRRLHSRVVSLHTPLLVPIIEDGRTADDPLVKIALTQYLDPLLKRNLDVLVLGCTHYPILRAAIEDICGPSVRVIDSSTSCADDVARRLARSGLLRAPLLEPPTQEAPTPVDHPIGELRCFVSDDPPRFAKLASRLLGFTVEEPQLVLPDDLVRVEAEFSARHAG